MNTNIENLNQLPLNKIGKIKKIDCEECIKRRLLDMGLVKGTNIEPILVSPSKDPRAFLVRGTIIAIRKEKMEKSVDGGQNENWREQEQKKFLKNIMRRRIKNFWEGIFIPFI